MKKFDIINVIDQKEKLDYKIERAFKTIVHNTPNFYQGIMNDCGNEINSCNFVSYSFDGDDFIIHYCFVGMGNMNFCSYNNLRDEFLRVPFEVIADENYLSYCKFLSISIQNHLDEKEEKVKQYYRDIAESERIRRIEQSEGKKRIFSGNYKYLENT